jgi:hypothetical protein
MWSPVITAVDDDETDSKNWQHCSENTSFCPSYKVLLFETKYFCVYYYRVDSVNLMESDAKKNTDLLMNSWLWNWAAVKLLY